MTWFLTISLALLVSIWAFNGTEVMVNCLRAMVSMGGGVPLGRNKNINSLISWVYYGNIYSDDVLAVEIMKTHSLALSVITKAVSGSFYLFCLYEGWKCRNGNRASKINILAIFIIVALCVSPVSWRSGYAAVLIPIAVFWARALRQPTRTRHLVLLALMSTVTGTIFLDVIAGLSLPFALRVLLCGMQALSCSFFVLDTLPSIVRESKLSLEAGPLLEQEI